MAQVAHIIIDITHAAGGERCKQCLVVIHCSYIDFEIVGHARLRVAFIARTDKLSVAHSHHAGSVYEPAARLQHPVVGISAHSAIAPVVRLIFIAFQWRMLKHNIRHPVEIHLDMLLRKVKPYQRSSRIAQLIFRITVSCSLRITVMIEKPIHVERLRVGRTVVKFIVEPVAVVIVAKLRYNHPSRRRHQTSKKQVVAEAAADVSRKAANVSAQAAKVAVKEEVGAAKDKAVNAISDVKDKAADAVSNAKDQAAEMVANAKDKVSDVAQAAKEKAGDLKDKAAEKGASILDKVKDFTADTLESAAKGAGHLADKLRD